MEEHSLSALPLHQIDSLLTEETDLILIRLSVQQHVQTRGLI